MKKGSPAIYAIEQGRVFPQLDDLATLHNRYGLNINWVISGKGNMILHGQKDSSEPGSLKAMIAQLRTEPENDELARKIDVQLSQVLNDLAKLEHIFNVIDGIKKDN